MAREPENDLHVCPVPTVSDMVGEETPRVVVVLVREKDAYTIGALRARIIEVAPDNAKVERARGGHDCDVRERPSAVVVRERVDCLQEERMAGN